MAVNLASQALGAHIRCDKPSCDGHDIENLIASADSTAGCPRRPSSGYLAAPFVKPPVNVTVTFPCPVDICRIDVGTRLGLHGASTVELLTHSPSRWPPLSTSDAVPATAWDAELFKPVGWHAAVPRGRAATPEGPNVVAVPAVPASLVCFENRAYKPRRPFGAMPPPLLPSEGAARTVLRTSAGLAHLSRVLRLIVRVVYVSGGRIPALSCLRVWGQPAAMPAADAAASAAYRTAFDRLLAAATSATASVPPSAPCIPSAPVPNPSPLPMSTPLPGTPATGSERKRKRSDHATDGRRLALHQPGAADGRSAGGDLNHGTVPVEFVDPITCEIMSLPVLLPSGNTVDQTTLERFADAEAAFGRPPSDPFTGVPLQAGVPPVPNVGLKVRIDQFLIEQGDRLASVARTVGTGRQAYERGSCCIRPDLCQGGRNRDTECGGDCSAGSRKPPGRGGGSSCAAASPIAIYLTAAGHRRSEISAATGTVAACTNFAACQGSVMPSTAAADDADTDCGRRAADEVLRPAAPPDGGRAAVARASSTAGDREAVDSRSPNDDLAERDEMPSRLRHEGRLAISLERSLQVVLGRLPAASSPADRIRAGCDDTDAAACHHLDRSSATLALSCGHSMCVLCARSSLKRPDEEGSRLTQLVCPMCGSRSASSSSQILHGPGRASAGLPGV